MHTSLAEWILCFLFGLRQHSRAIVAHTEFLIRFFGLFFSSVLSAAIKIILSCLACVCVRDFKSFLMPFFVYLKFFLFVHCKTNYTGALTKVLGKCLKIYSLVSLFFINIVSWSVVICKRVHVLSFTARKIFSIEWSRKHGTNHGLAKRFIVFETNNGRWTRLYSVNG